MMKLQQFKQLIPTAKEALAGFLSTLVGDTLDLQVAPVANTTFQEVAPEAQNLICLLSADPAFSVQLGAGWLPLLSEMMLGEAMKFGDDGAEDLLQELAAQGFGSIRNQLAQDGVKLSDTMLQVIPPNEALGAMSLPQDLLRINFEVKANGRPLSGFVLIPSAHFEQPAPAMAAAPAAGMPGMGHVSPEGPAVSVAPAAFPDLGREQIGGDGAGNFSLLAEVELEVSVELGRRKLPLAEVLKLTTGSIVELEKLVGEPLAVFANGRLIAEGEAIVIDEQFGIRITSLVTEGAYRRVSF